MKKVIPALALALAAALVTVGVVSAAPIPPDITLSTIGSRYTNTDIPIKGYFSDTDETQAKTIVVQRNINGTWTDQGSTTGHLLDGAYTGKTQQVATAGTWQFRTRLFFGQALLATSNTIDVVVKQGTTTPPPPPPPTGSVVTIGSQSYPLKGVNVTRTTDSLVQYTPAKGATTGTNQYGYEAAVEGGKVTKVASGVGNMAIPASGYVLSGHGAAKTWLAANAKVGVAVTVPGGSGGGGGGGTAPAAVTEKRTIDGKVTCTTLKVAVENQERTNTWQWNGTAWVDNWSAWKTVSTGTRAAKAADCINPVSAAPSDALLPDIRIKNLDKCGTGDMNATNGKCFLILNPAPANPDFPALEGKKLLKFPVITLNVGDGPLEVIAGRTDTSASDWKAWQTFYRPNGERQSVLSPNVKFYFAGDGHNHWHFTDFDNYWIETLGGMVQRSAEKHGYCLEDNTTWSGLAGQAGVPGAPVYANATTCGLGLKDALDIIEGLSRGWGDTYPLSLPDQAIDITGLPDGRYRVGITADALKVVAEKSETNNTATMEISISGNTVTTYPATATGGLS